jgi:hypothetical protein
VGFLVEGVFVAEDVVGEEKIERRRAAADAASYL